MHGSHLTNALQLSNSSKDYNLLCSVFFLPLQEFCDIFHYHAWKCKTIYSCFIPNEGARMTDNSANIYPEIALCKYFEQLVHFLGQLHTRNACQQNMHWCNEGCCLISKHEKKNPASEALLYSTSPENACKNFSNCLSLRSENRIYFLSILL